MKTFKLLLLAVGLVASTANITDAMVSKGATATSATLTDLQQQEITARLTIISEQSANFNAIKMSASGKQKFLLMIETLLTQFADIINSFNLPIKEHFISHEEAKQYFRCIQQIIETKKNLINATTETGQHEFYTPIIAQFDNPIKRTIKIFLEHCVRFSATNESARVFLTKLDPRAEKYPHLLPVLIDPEQRKQLITNLLNRRPVFAKNCMNKSTICTFCRDTENQSYWTQLDCGHWFHETCLKTQLPDTLQCPKCNSGEAAADSGITFRGKQ